MKYFKATRKRWDTYFYNLCNAVALQSPCLSRKIGCVIVRENSILSTGYNGPPRGIPHCGEDRIKCDKSLSFMLDLEEFKECVEELKTTCPRKLLGFESGTHMEWCTAQHAEENAVSNAARNGTNIKDSILYMNSVIPCNKCFGTLINAGITEIVITDITPYDDHTQFLIDYSNIKIRKFTL